MDDMEYKDLEIERLHAELAMYKHIANSWKDKAMELIREKAELRKLVRLLEGRLNGD